MIAVNLFHVALISERFSAVAASIFVTTGFAIILMIPTLAALVIRSTVIESVNNEFVGGEAAIPAGVLTLFILIVAMCSLVSAEVRPLLQRELLEPLFAIINVFPEFPFAETSISIICRGNMCSCYRFGNRVSGQAYARAYQAERCGSFK